LEASFQQFQQFRHQRVASMAMAISSELRLWRSPSHREFVAKARGWHV
jgi:hypothetical protein